MKMLCRHLLATIQVKRRIIAGRTGAEPPPETGPASFFGYPILTLLHTEDLLAVHLRKLLSDIDADNRVNTKPNEQHHASANF